MSRPELITAPELFYNDKEARKYTANSRMITIQTSMAERCLELLALPPSQPSLILDIGCGSGLSGEVLTAAGHTWVGMDVSKDMLDVGLEESRTGDLILSDMGQGFGFRPGSFDGAISVSAVQWLCYSIKKDHIVSKRLTAFFSSLYRALKRGARAALQLYPENPEQLEMMTTAALRCGFSGGLVVDFPNSTKAKKYYLCLIAGVDPGAALPKALGTAVAAAAAEKKRVQAAAAARSTKKSKSWILAKQDRQRRQGKDVRHSSKYTGRKRKDQF